MRRHLQGPKMPSTRIAPSTWAPTPSPSSSSASSHRQHYLDVLLLSPSFRFEDTANDAHHSLAFHVAIKTTKHYRRCVRAKLPFALSDPPEDGQLQPIACDATSSNMASDPFNVRSTPRCIAPPLYIAFALKSLDMEGWLTSFQQPFDHIL
jgi:hypothetical protein